MMTTFRVMAAIALQLLGEALRPRTVGHAASFMYTPSKADLFRGLTTRDYDTSAMRAILVMSNTTADTDQDVQFVSGIGTLDECDGANYVRKTLAGQTITQDDPNNRGEFDATDITWTALGAGTRSNVGVLIIFFITNDAASPNVAYIDTGGFPINGNGGDLTIQWNAEGIIQTT